MLKKDTECIAQLLTRACIVSATLVKVENIIFNTTISNQISNVLLLDLYLLMWGSLESRKSMTSHF